MTLLHKLLCSHKVSSVILYNTKQYECKIYTTGIAFLNPGCKKRIDRSLIICLKVVIVSISASCTRSS